MKLVRMAVGTALSIDQASACKVLQNHTGTISVFYVQKSSLGLCPFISPFLFYLAAAPPESNRTGTLPISFLPHQVEFISHEICLGTLLKLP